jgi:uncharacterized repeat protein (TIGR04076 family)
MVADVKITVLQRLLIEDACDKYGAGNIVACQKVAEGDQFIVSGESIEMPEGFCSWAWHDIHSYLVTLARGGNFVGAKRGKTVVACADGFRPVIFALERMEPARS